MKTYPYDGLPSPSSLVIDGLGSPSYAPWQVTDHTPVAVVALGIHRPRSVGLDHDERISMVYKWEVKNPINNYNIIPNIGKYVNFTDCLELFNVSEPFCFIKR